MWTELAEDADVSGGLRSEDGGLPAQPAVIKEYGRFAYLEGKSAGAGQEELVFNAAAIFQTFQRGFSENQLPLSSFSYNII